MRTIISILLFHLLSISCLGAQPSNLEILKNGIITGEEIINTPSWEFSPTFYNGLIAFVSSKGGNIFYDEDKKTPYFDLAFSAPDIEGTLARKAFFPPELSSENQEGPFCFYDAGRYILLTRSHPETGRLTLYQARKLVNRWTDMREVYLLPDIYHQCHPSVSPDGNQLVFAASNNKKTDMDLYIADYVNGRYANPVVLGSNINSPSNDWFPRFIDNQTIVFASDRIGGIGGLDMYYVTLTSDGWSEPSIIPEPINGVNDDFGLVINDINVGYFTSNREGGKGQDDLYRVEFSQFPFSYEDSETINTLRIPIIIQDKLSLTPIAGARITITKAIEDLSDVNKNDYSINLIPEGTEEGELLLRLTPKGSSPNFINTTAQDGSTFIDVDRDSKYLLNVKKEGYETFNLIYNRSIHGENLNLVLEPKGENKKPMILHNPMVKISTGKGDVTVFNNLYYDLNSHIIKQGATHELDALVSVMKENPTMVIQLSSHTDSRGTISYNQQLSDKRALSAQQYLVDRGVQKNRIIALGYGESQLRNHCTDNSQCSEEEHAYNRRTEVMVVSY